ncbi:MULTISPECIES: TIGR01906 family membrane protein [unclassified Aerococcus]|uniref:TIGR01906 family membrane protein n=1 Tax=unclassified Aerococcus TaxID=2618060 RepID=UPI0025BA39D1|nr:MULTISPECIES: TIGR01906 family membrane protein [unclassified Aerococcus]
MKHSYRSGSKLLHETRLWLGILALLIFFITLAITVTIANVPLFMGSLWFSKSFDAVDLTFWTVVDNYLQLLAYLNFPWVETLAMSDFPTSASAAFHFMEVKHLFYLNYVAMLISGLIGAFTLHKLTVTRDLWRLYWPFKQLRWLPIIVIILLVFNFNAIFIAFHEIAFNNDAWLFNPETDPIILVLHESFFLLCFVSVFLILQLAIEWVYRIGKKDFNRQILGI